MFKIIPFQTSLHLYTDKALPQQNCNLGKIAAKSEQGQIIKHIYIFRKPRLTRLVVKGECRSQSQHATSAKELCFQHPALEYGKEFKVGLIFFST